MITKEGREDKEDMEGKVDLEVVEGLVVPPIVGQKKTVKERLYLTIVQVFS
jgi:hypothetical protein